MAEIFTTDVVHWYRDNVTAFSDFMFYLLSQVGSGPTIRSFLIGGGNFLYPGGIAMRPDRQPGNRGAFEAARKKILATQTICGICGKPVDFSYKPPHPLSPTVDHIIPVSKNGHPSDLANLQLAHRCCNREKADKLIDRSRRLAEEESTLVSNQLLELHCDWKAYKAN